MFPDPQRAAHESLRAWHEAIRLVMMVGAGARIPAIPPSIMLRPGEVQHGGPFGVDCYVFCGADVEYSQGYAVSGGLLFTAVGMAIGEASIAHARREALAHARPQWRLIGRMPMVLTDRRMLIMPEGQWCSYSLDTLVSMTAQVEAYGMDLHFEDAMALRLMGQWIPWAAVAVAALCNPRPWPPPFFPRHLLPRIPVSAPAPKALTAAPVPDPDPDDVLRRVAALDPAAAAGLLRSLRPDLAQWVLANLDMSRAEEIRRYL
jgi:hypothetical protein